MSVAQRLSQLERAEQEREVSRLAAQIAQRHGRDPTEVVRRAAEIAQRIERWGLGTELRRFAAEHALTDEEARARYAEVVAEMAKDR